MSVTVNPEVVERRKRLAEIVERLGPEATGSMIREEAYRVGLGVVNSAMLTFVRSVVFPERLKRGGGRPIGSLDRMPVRQKGLHRHRSRICTRCEIDKPSIEFGTSSGRVRSICRQCASEYRCSRGRKQVFATFGLTDESYEKMLHSQGYKCAICLVDSPGGSFTQWAIDHCHSTGDVRGLLCCRCNLALGNFRDSVELMKSAIAYLEQERR